MHLYKSSACSPRQSTVALLATVSDVPANSDGPLSRSTRIDQLSRNTTRGRLTILLSALLPALLASNGWAALNSAIPSQWFPPDARSQGLGRAYTAIAEGPSAIWWNPAGLALIDGLHGTPYARFPLQPAVDGYEIGALELSGGRNGLGFGAHLHRMDYGRSEFRDETGRTLGRFEPYEYVGLLGGAIDLNQRAIHGSPALALGVGANLKMFHTKLAPARLAANHRDWEGTSWDLDLGGLAAYKMPLHAPALTGKGRASFVELRGGATLHNALAREISYLEDGAKHSLGRELRAGAAVRAGVMDLAPLSYLVEATVSAERNWELEPVSGTPGDFYGVEMTLLGIASLRHGWVRDDEGQTHDTITGYGVGCDVQMDEHRRVGFRYDFASVPSANEFWESDARTVSVWMTW